MNECKLLIGIDPGKHGAIACILEEDDNHSLLHLYDIPLIKHVKKTKKRETGKIKTKITTEFDLKELSILLRNIKNMTKSRLIAFKVEKVHVRYGDGRQGAFSFGYGYGLIKGILESLGVPAEDITIPFWKKKFGIQEKEDAISVAFTHIYGINKYLQREHKDKLRIDQAEAMLIGLA